MNKINEIIKKVQNIQQKTEQIETSILNDFLDDTGTAPEEFEQVLKTLQRLNRLLIDYEQKLHNKLNKS